MKAIGLAVLILSLLIFLSIFGSGYLVSGRQSMEETIAAQAGQIAALEAQLVERDQANSALQGTLSGLQAEHAHVQAALEAAQSDLAQSQTALDEHETRVAALSQELGTVQDQLAATQAQYLQSSAQVGLLAAELSAAQENLRVLAQQAAAQQTAAQQTAAGAGGASRMDLYGETTSLLIAGLGVAGMAVSGGMQLARLIRERLGGQPAQHASRWDDPHYRQVRREQARQAELRTRSGRG